MFLIFVSREIPVKASHDFPSCRSVEVDPLSIFDKCAVFSGNPMGTITVTPIFDLEPAILINPGADSFGY